MGRRRVAPLAVLAFFAIYLSPLPVHGGVTTVGLVFWRESGRTPGPLGWLFAFLAAFLFFQAVLGLLVYWTLRRPSRSRVVKLLLSPPVIATLFVFVLFSIGQARYRRRRLLVKPTAAASPCSSGIHRRTCGPGSVPRGG